MYFNPTCVPKIKKILVELQSKNNSGVNEIPMSIAKVTPENIFQALTYIFNLSLAQGKFINAFEKSKVIPEHQKGLKIDEKTTGLSVCSPSCLICV